MLALIARHYLAWREQAQMRRELSNMNQSHVPRLKLFFVLNEKPWLPEAGA
jgi:hypothetical protein